MFIVTGDWFFASHNLPMTRAARELGLEVIVVARVRNHRAAFEATGATVINLDVERARLNPLSPESRSGHGPRTGVRMVAAYTRRWREVLDGGLLART